MIHQQFTKGDATILLWKMEEDETELLNFLQLETIELNSYYSLKTSKRKQEYLGVRAALKTFFGKNKIIYNAERKPFLADNSAKISVSHSGQWLALMVHPNAEVGIDIECPSNKIEQLAVRFLCREELETITGRKQHIAWSAKEALYKIIGKQAVDFPKQLRILPFDIVGNEGEFNALHVPSDTVYTGNYLLTEEYTLVYITSKQVHE